MIIREMYVDEEKEFRADLSNEEFLNEYLDESFVATNVYVVESSTNIKLGYAATVKFVKEHTCICYLYVKPEYRGMGFGKWIIKEMVDTLKNKGNDYVYGIVDQKNKIAMRFYCTYYKFLTKNLTIEKCSYLEKNKEHLFTNEDGFYEVVFYKKEVDV